MGLLSLMTARDEEILLETVLPFVAHRTCYLFRSGPRSFSLSSVGSSICRTFRPGFSRFLLLFFFLLFQQYKYLAI